MAEAAEASVEDTKDPTNIEFEVDKLDELLADVGPVRVPGGSHGRHSRSPLSNCLLSGRGLPQITGSVKAA